MARISAVNRTTSVSLGSRRLVAGRAVLVHGARVAVDACPRPAPALVRRAAAPDSRAALPQRSAAGADQAPLPAGLRPRTAPHAQSSGGGRRKQRRFSADVPPLFPPASKTSAAGGNKGGTRRDKAAAFQQDCRQDACRDPGYIRIHVYGYRRIACRVPYLEHASGSDPDSFHPHPTTRPRPPSTRTGQTFFPRARRTSTVSRPPRGVVPATPRSSSSPAARPRHASRHAQDAQLLDAALLGTHCANPCAVCRHRACSALAPCAARTRCFRFKGAHKLRPALPYCRGNSRPRPAARTPAPAILGTTKCTTKAKQTQASPHQQPPR